MEDTTLRTVPQQARSQQRVDLILDVTAALFAEIGYESTTTNAIAERAGISIGSLYRYFPDKDAILQAIAKRYLAQLRALYDEVFSEDTIYLPLSVVLDRLIDPFVELHMACPAYKHLLLGSDASSDIAAAYEALDREIVERLGGLFRLIVPEMDERRAHLIATVCKAEVKALLSVLDTASDEEHRAQIIQEFKTVMHAYLAPIVGGR